MGAAPLSKSASTQQGGARKNIGDSDVMKLRAHGQEWAATSGKLCSKRSRVGAQRKRRALYHSLVEGAVLRAVGTFDCMSEDGLGGKAGGEETNVQGSYVCEDLYLAMSVGAKPCMLDDRCACRARANAKVLAQSYN